MLSRGSEGHLATTVLCCRARLEWCVVPGQAGVKQSLAGMGTNLVAEWTDLFL